MIRVTYPSSCYLMDTMLIFFQDRLDRFEKWFNDRFGWFFTNGMKDRRRRKPRLY